MKDSTLGKPVIAPKENIFFPLGELITVVGKMIAMAMDTASEDAIELQTVMVNLEIQIRLGGARKGFKRESGAIMIIAKSNYAGLGYLSWVEMCLHDDTHVITISVIPRKKSLAMRNVNNSN